MQRQPQIAILSLSCRFPDANSPAELWCNAIEGRRSFREIPKERLNLHQYTTALVGAADSITQVKAGLLTGWHFDRARFRVPAPTFAATDLTHWLALELAANAIGIIGLESINRPRTAVVVANTLTGEFSRAAVLRHRLPFLDATLSQVLDAHRIDQTVSARLRSAFDGEVRKRFPEPNEDSLAGGLANTIAGRVANYFDLGGGAYTVDGACASSLVAVADAANLLATEQADAVVVGAVDLSIDPFELIGFSRNGALAQGDMRVFDKRSAGFWPGEGGAFAVLMRDADARRKGIERLAILRGWGLSSDGAGGLTRPSSEGQLMAYRRAYEGAEADPADLAFVEAHGTGTAVGDPVEIRALAALRVGVRRPLAIGSIKANIGHAKAAAGLAGLAKSVESLRQGVFPPHVGCGEPHPEFAETDGRVEPSLVAREVDGHLAGISSFGFGGINSHVVLERTTESRSSPILVSSPSFFDAELFLFAGSDSADLIRRLDVLLARAPSLSLSEMMDASAAVSLQPEAGSCRVAIVASDPRELAHRLPLARSLLQNGQSRIARDAGVFVANGGSAPRIGYVFPGQGAPSNPLGGLWARCFAAVEEFSKQLPRTSRTDWSSTGIAQPTIVAAGMAGLAVLDNLGVRAELAIGHSLGEISALAWGGVLSRSVAVDLAARRGVIMERHAVPGGRMLRAALSAADAEELAISAAHVEVACENGPDETVLAGPLQAIERVRQILERRRIDHSILATSHAFHSADIMGAVAPLRDVLARIDMGVCSAPVVSTVTARYVERSTDIRALLARQLVSRVRFKEALSEARERVDLIVEVGPGQGLARLVERTGLPALPVDSFGSSIAPLLLTLAELHARGQSLVVAPLFDGRSPRRLEMTPPTFLSSPCAVIEPRHEPTPVEASSKDAPSEERIIEIEPDVLSSVLSVISSQTGLPVEAIGLDDRFLDSLHLNSLSVSRIVTAAAKAVDAPPPATPTEFANATPRMLASALEELRDLAPRDAGVERVAGVRPWVDTYAMRWTERVESGRRSEHVAWEVVELAEAGSLAEFPVTLDGWLVRLRSEMSCEDAQQLVRFAAEAARRKVAHFSIVHEGAPVAAFARSLALEDAFETVKVVYLEKPAEQQTQLAEALSLETGRYTELLLDAEGTTRTPEFLPTLPEGKPDHANVGAGDIVLIIGGGRGIASECALEMGRRGAKLILVGRSSAANDQVSATLGRAASRGISCMYVSADACDIRQLETALSNVFAQIGKPTVLVHAAGVNEPGQIARIDSGVAQRCLTTKLIAFRNAISLCGNSLRRVITFGSLIGRIGLEGEAHYALANEALSLAATRWANGMPGRSALAIEWSIWGASGWVNVLARLNVYQPSELTRFLSTMR